MNDIAFAEIDLMTKEQLAAEIIRRPKPALVIFQEDEGNRVSCFQSFHPEGDPLHMAIPELLRLLADMFEDAEYVPGETPEGEQ